MNNILLLLFFEYFKIGLFTYGGGYASLPFLFHLSEYYKWFSYDELTQLIAISGITPGPVGLNMATFSGFKTMGITGALIASLAFILPMLLITVQVFKVLDKFKENKYVKSVLYILRPTSCALILSVGLKLFYNSILIDLTFKNIDYLALFVVLILFLMTFKCKRDPAIYIFSAGILGIIVKNLF